MSKLILQRRTTSVREAAAAEGGIGVDYPVAARSFFFFSPVHFYLPSLSPSASLLQFMRHQLRKQSLQIQTAAQPTVLYHHKATSFLFFFQA